MERRIVVKIPRTGSPVIEAEGFQGVGCADATKNIEAALSAGKGNVERVLKPEWQQVEETQVEMITEKW